jgi:hypothetical protein
VTQKLAEHEYRRLDVEGQRIVLERSSMPVPHQVVDQALRAGRVSVDVLEALLALRRDAGREEDVGVAGAGANQIDRDVGPELDPERALDRHGSEATEPGPPS